MNRRLFADTATIRAAAFDLLDRGWLVCGEANEDDANVERGEFVDALISRIAQLQAPPHYGPKLENLCLTHLQQALGLPPTSVALCVACERLKRKGKTDGR